MAERFLDHSQRNALGEQQSRACMPQVVEAVSGDAGRKGGQAVQKTYGREHYSRMGKLGGRPTFAEYLERAKAKQAERSRRAREQRKEALANTHPWPAGPFSLTAEDIDTDK